MITIEKSKRIRELPPYLFARIDAIKAEKVAKGVDVIDFTIGDPDLPTPKGIVEAMKQSIGRSQNHRYPSYVGMLAFRATVAKWYRNRFGVTLDSEKEVIALIGSKEGIAHIPLAFVDAGDYALVPDPGYPVYRTSILFANGIPHLMPLLRKNHYLPDLTRIPEEIARKAKLIFFNYPNNPTSATCDRGFFEHMIVFCQKHNVIACHDAAYSEVYYDEHKPMSFMEVEGAKEIGIEFHSLSKTFNMTGWRLGFAVGNAEIVRGLGQIKENVDSGVFQSVQEAGIAAFEENLEVTGGLRNTYRERRDLLVSGLRQIGLDAEPPRATFYVWTPTPKSFTSMEFITHLLDRVGVLATPGNGFGPSGEGFIRFSLTTPTERIKEAVHRLSSLSF